jgi:hypothetical protein
MQLNVYDHDGDWVDRLITPTPHLSQCYDTSTISNCLGVDDKTLPRTSTSEVTHHDT